MIQQMAPTVFWDLYPALRGFQVKTNYARKCTLNLTEILEHLGFLILKFEFSVYEKAFINFIV